MLGRYCVDAGGGRYYDTLRQRHLAADELDGSLMLAGQERRAVMSVLEGRHDTIVTVIPSWECNLRCPHCYVAPLLKRPGTDAAAYSDESLERLVRFMDRVRDERPRMFCHLVGGEPLLHPEFCREVANWCRSNAVPSSITTNGMWDFDAAVPALTLLDSVAFSIDGLPPEHNAIRRSLLGDPDPFGTVYRNLARTIRDLPHVTVSVQGSSTGNPPVSYLNRFRVLMLLAGVHPERITLGPAAATERKPGGEAHVARLPRETRRSPCCDWKLGRSLIVHAGLVYPSYYRLNRREPLGTVDDPLDRLLDGYRTGIREMPMLNDPVCMDECRAVGVCWGLCTNVQPSFRDGRPSSVCDRAYKEALVRQIAVAEDPPCRT